MGEVEVVESDASERARAAAAARSAELSGMTRRGSIKDRAALFGGGGGSSTSSGTILPATMGSVFSPGKIDRHRASAFRGKENPPPSAGCAPPPPILNCDPTFFALQKKKHDDEVRHKRLQEVERAKHYRGRIDDNPTNEIHSEIRRNNDRLKDAAKEAKEAAGRFSGAKCGSILQGHGDELKKQAEMDRTRRTETDAKMKVHSMDMRCNTLDWTNAQMKKQSEEQLRAKRDVDEQKKQFKGLQEGPQMAHARSLKEKKEKERAANRAAQENNNTRATRPRNNQSSRTTTETEHHTDGSSTITRTTKTALPNGETHVSVSTEHVAAAAPVVGSKTGTRVLDDGSEETEVTNTESMPGGVYKTVTTKVITRPNGNREVEETTTINRPGGNTEKSTVKRRLPPVRRKECTEDSNTQIDSGKSSDRKKKSFLKFKFK